MKTSLFWVLLGALLTIQVLGMREDWPGRTIRTASLVITLVMTAILFWGKS